MCDLCIQHGEGRKWYLQAKNYGEELLSEERRRGFVDTLANVEEIYVDAHSVLDKLAASDPAAARATRLSRVDDMKKTAWGQIVPIEDAERVLEMSTNIVRLSCACRRIFRGAHDARYCFCMNMNWDPILQYPDYSADFEVLTSEEAKSAFRHLDREGMVHHVRTYTPYIYSVCNCDATDCVALRARARLGATYAFYKAEYVSTIDWEKCNGCRECMRLCNFGAIGYSLAAEKCYINQSQCFGCGVCRSACPGDAITLRDRNAIPALANEW